MKSLARKSAPAVELRDVLERDVQSALEKLQARRGIDVHAVRKRIKHARAVVRLWRYELSDASYQRINLGLRDAARPLAQTRDTEVLLATIASLQCKHRVTSLQPLRDALVREQRKSPRTSTATRHTALAKRRLEVIGRAIAKTEVAPAADWSAILGAVGHSYRRARKAARSARSEPTSDKLHEWRKQVKYLWHQVQMLIPQAPRPLRRLARDLHRLADHLGDDHDLALLAARIEQGKELDADCRQDLARWIARRRARLERKAHELGTRLFADKPKQLERKLKQRLGRRRPTPNA